MPTSQLSFLEQVLQSLAQRMRRENYEYWFRSFQLHLKDENKVEFKVPSVFIRDWLNRNYLETICQAVEEVSGQRLTVNITLDPELQPQELETAALETGATGTFHALSEDIHGVMDEVGQAMGGDHGMAATASSSDLGSPAIGGNGLGQRGPDLYSSQQGNRPAQRSGGLNSPTTLNQDYTFEQFVVGPCNQLSHAASLAVGQNPGCAYNPLFIHGNVGLGKTHLLQSICHVIKRQHGVSRVLYLSCEDFTNRFISSAQNRSLDQFREFYRNADVLVIDDVQFLAGKEKTQSEFFHTFNHLYNAKKQIVISSDRPPPEIPTVEERLVSRFKWGLVTHMEQPCFDTRLTIVKRKARLRSTELSDDVCQFIAEQITANVRELEGAVIKVLGLAAITDRPHDLALAEEALQGISTPQPYHIRVSDIISLITSEFSISARELTGKKRTQAISLPRQIGMYLARERTEHSLEDIGRSFGNRDHTTVIYAVSKIKELAKKDRMFKELLARLSNRLCKGRF